MANLEDLYATRRLAAWLAGWVSAHDTDGEASSAVSVLRTRLDDFIQQAEEEEAKERKDGHPEDYQTI